jgi:hypothetical protein
MQNCQHEVRWIIALILFFLERDLILDTMFALIGVVFEVLN